MGRRERHRARTREAMLAVAYRLFREKGYDATSVEEIAAQAQVSPRTFYRYFTSKDAVLAEHGLLVTNEVLDRVPPHPSVHELLEQFATVMEEAAVHDHFKTHARLLRENPRLADCAPGWRQAWADRLAEGLAAKEGRDRPDLECRVRSTVAILLTAIALDRWLYEQPETRLVVLAREVADMGARQFTGER